MTASVEVVGGNVYDKYHASNPVARFLVDRYFKAFESMLEGLRPCRILEVGCGEGEIMSRLGERFPSAVVSGIDLSFETLLRATRDLDRPLLARAAGGELPFQSAQFDLVVCVEVLEHTREPDKVLRELGRVASGHLLISVPAEPLWRLLNIARGAYWTKFGNTPGHLQHWSSREFKLLLERHFYLRTFAKPLPWSMAFCSPKS